MFSNDHNKTLQKIRINNANFIDDMITNNIKLYNNMWDFLNFFYNTTFWNIKQWSKELKLFYKYIKRSLHLNSINDKSLLQLPNFFCKNTYDFMVYS